MSNNKSKPKLTIEQRYEVMLMILNGYKNATIARTFSIEESSVIRIKKAYLPFYFLGD